MRVTTDDTQVIGVDTDRRGKLPDMRIQSKFSDGCGYQYVQREAAHGTASLYGDTGVIGLHIRLRATLFQGYSRRRRQHQSLHHAP